MTRVGRVEQQLRMDFEAVTAALGCLSGTFVTRALVVVVSQFMLQNG